MIDNMSSITTDEIIPAAKRMKQAGYRLVTLTAVDLNAHEVDLIYHFDREITLQHFRVNVSKNRPVPSICGVYFAAVLVENEIQDQFGLRFDGLALDYEAGLYLEEEAGRTPFCKYGVIKGTRTSSAAEGR